MRAGTRNYKGLEVPEHAKICTYDNGDEFYVSSIKNDFGIWTVTIRYIETGEFKNVSYNLIEKYL